MTFAEFTGLSKEQKTDAIWEWGFFLGTNKNSDTNRILYAMNGYFAEMILELEGGKVSDVLPYKELNSKTVKEFSLSSDNPFIKASVDSYCQH